jgi:hypothetical protein
MRWMGLLAVIGSLALVAAGCGGSDGGNAVATGETTTEETTTEETTTEETGETTTDTDVSGTGLSEDCKKLGELSNALSQAGASSGDSSNGLADLAAALSAFAAQAPEAIRDDYRTLAEAYVKFAEATKDIDVSSGETPSAADIAKLTEASQALATSDVTAASARISAWTLENCTTTTP